MPTELTTVCVFCASSPGRDPRLAQEASRFGALLARRGLTVVTGGGHVGLMGAVADGALAEGGAVHGVITRALEEREVAHRGLTSLEVVETMHERKAAMSGRADAFVMLPGGFGTLDEFFEALTWTQLGIHAKPCGVLDVAGYFEPLVDFVARAADLGLVRPEHRDLVVCDPDPSALLDRLARWEPVTTDTWLERGARPADES
ncbi:MAG: TIGR00730 family Rossman fold protein [Acidimicrobiales bacterium]